MFYTGPILKLQVGGRINNDLKESNINSPNFYGLINPFLQKIVDSPSIKEVENNKNESNSLVSVIYSDRNNLKRKEKKLIFMIKKMSHLIKLLIPILVLILIQILIHLVQVKMKLLMI